MHIVPSSACAQPNMVSPPQSLHSRVVALQRERDNVLAVTNKDMDAVNSMIARAWKMSRSLEQSVHSQVDEITQKYRAEVLQRKLLYNKVQELRGNIRVFFRCRFDQRCVLYILYIL